LENTNNINKLNINSHKSFQMMSSLLERTPEQKLDEMIKALSLFEPFDKYSLFRTDSDWTDDVTRLFRNNNQELLCIYELHYNPSPVLEIASKKGFKIDNDYVLDHQTFNTSVKRIGIILRRNVEKIANNDDDHD